MQEQNDPEANAEALAPAHPFYLRKEVRAPLAWLTLVVLAELFFNPWTPGVRRWRSTYVLGSLGVYYLWFGGVFSVPLHCALWAAWGPDALRWRLAIGAAAAVGLGLLASSADGNAAIPIIFASLFTLFWVTLALVRVGRGVCFRAPDTPVEPRRVGFGIGYLLGLTAVISLLAALGQQGLIGIAGVGPSALHFVISVVVIGLLVLQSVLAWVLILGARRRVLVGLLGVPVTVAAVSFAAATAIQPGPNFWEVFSIASGAVVFTTGFGVALRLGGYRLAGG